MTRRSGLTLVEISVAAVLLALLLYVVAGAITLAKSHFLAGEVAHAVQAAVVMGARLEDDLRSAVRAPDSDTALTIVTKDARPTFSFYRLVLADDVPAIVPVRWQLQDATGTTQMLTRVAWDPAKAAFVQDRYAWASIARTGTASAGASFSLIGDLGDTDVQVVWLSVLARARHVDSPGAVLDRATVPVAACIPRPPAATAALFAPLKRIEELP